VAITTSSASTARAINEEIQWRHHLSRPGGPSVPMADGTRLHVGDRIATRRNDPTLVTDAGVSVRNRHTWTVTHIHGDGAVTVTDDPSGTVTLPSHYVAEHVELGWAVTGYGNQGITTDHAVCVIEPGTSRASVYVGLTRGRGKNLAVIADPTGTADPAEALARAIARPPNATTAHAARDQLHRAQGLEPPAITPATEVDDVERTRILLDQYAESVRHRPPLSRGL
jgi:ATP-dependent exoDNAse (exonuclease V) alpha subunit